jgi:hypothetical protein
MNYASSLPKISFESTAGKFTISSFYSFYEYNPKKLNLTKTVVDNRTTLTELSQKIYKDNNSMWLFLIANDTTDPFDLLAMNPALHVDKTKNNINLGLYKTTEDTTYVNPVGSLLTPYTETGGSAWQYSSIGNFDLDGPFTIIENTDYYTGKMVIKDQKGSDTPFITLDPEDSEALVPISYETSGFTTDNETYNTKNKKQELENAVNITTKDSNVIDPGTSNYPPASEFGGFGGGEPSYGNDGATATVSDYEKLLAQNKNINVLVPDSVSSLFNNLKKMSFT